MLEWLFENPETVATLPLNPILGVPDGHMDKGRHRPLINPRLSIVKWETGIWGDVIKHIGSLGTHRFEIDFNPNRKYKAALTPGKILVLIRTTETDEEPETHRSDSESVCHGYMGAQVGMMKKNKSNEGVTTPSFEANIKHQKATHTSDKRVGKGQKEREVLGWFVQEGTAY